MSAEIVPIRTRRSLYASVPGVDYLKRNTRTGVYYVRKHRSGKAPLFKSTGEKTLGRAKTQALNILDAWLGVGGKTLAKRKTVNLILDELRDALEEEFRNGDRRARTWGKDQDLFKVIRRHFGDVYVDEIDEDFWEDWVRSRGRRLGRTLFDIAKYLSKTLTFAYRRRLIARKPFIRNPDKAKKSGTVLTDQQIAKIVAKADATLILQITLAYECGLRTGEIRGIQHDMLRVGADGVTCVLPDWYVKANARSILLSPRAAELLAAHPRHGSKFVFPAPHDEARCESAVHHSRRWRRALGKAGLPATIKFYDLRRSFYNKTILEMGLPIQLVSEYGGTSIRTLQKAYLQGSAERTAAISRAIRIKLGGSNGDS